MQVVSKADKFCPICHDKMIIPITNVVDGIRVCGIECARKYWHLKKNGIVINLEQTQLPLN